MKRKKDKKDQGEMYESKSYERDENKRNRITTETKAQRKIKRK